MLNYDVIVIGSGVAGYTAALKCLDAGLNTAVVSSGQSALHFSSGSIDLLSHSPLTNQPVRHPWQEIEQLATVLPQHPYAKLSVEKIRHAMNWFQSLMAREGLPLSCLANQDNHYRITTLGTLKSTWLSQPYVSKLNFDFQQLATIKRIVMVSVDGFRDFQPQIAKDNLKCHPRFKSIPIKIANVSLTAFGQLNRNPHDFRSIDISRILRDEHQFKEFANQLVACANTDDLVIIPAILGNGDGLTLMNKLHHYTRLQFHEVPTMPPSLLGIRIEEVLMHAFINHGGILHKGDEVLGGQIDTLDGTQQLTQLRTQKMAEIGLTANHYILASGSFFSKGLVARQQTVVEPVFGLDIEATGERANWYQSDFFSRQPHAFLSFGVKTNQHFHPFVNGVPISNLFCIGSILSGYDPIAHGCGGGVAISTACAAVDSIMNREYRITPAQEVNA